MYIIYIIIFAISTVNCSINYYNGTYTMEGSTSFNNSLGIYWNYPIKHYHITTIDIHVSVHDNGNNTFYLKTILDRKFCHEECYFVTQFAINRADHNKILDIYSLDPNAGVINVNYTILVNYQNYVINDMVIDAIFATLFSTIGFIGLCLCVFCIVRTLYFMRKSKIILQNEAGMY